MTTARLALANGALFRGDAFGAAGEGLLVQAEVVFNTALTGYQESLTDPSYAGQILVQTTPLIGNTGVNEEDVESDRVRVSGFVVHELTRRHSNFRATGDLSSYLRAHGVLGLSGIDTRALTRNLRSMGVVPGVLTDRDDIADAELVRRAQAAPSMQGCELVSNVSGQIEAWDENLGAWAPPYEGTVPEEGRPLRVLAIDCGAKRNILRHLRQRGCEVKLVPWDTPAGELKAAFERGEADGLFISNGPGDPAAVDRTVDALREIIAGEDCPPTFGICLGHQLLARASGAETFKLPFGHRGTNQPVRDDETGVVSITSHNHGFAVLPESLLSAGGEVTHTHLNDHTVAGFRMRGRPVFAVQYHPEASPGPHDAASLFDRFVAMMRERAG